MAPEAMGLEDRGHVLALCGGVGGAKLAHGLSRVLPAQNLTIIVNTGDDFEHLGLHISPDIDTVVYTLADLADRERGWGLIRETWGFMAALARLGGEDWFSLGDQDMAMHIERTRRLTAGLSLSAVTTELSGALGLRCAIAPMSDDPVRTIVRTAAGDLAFQHYFVRERCAPIATAIRFDGAGAARVSPALAAALARRDLSAILICPSNPYLSIDPILAIPGVRAAILANAAPCIAVSPVVGGAAIKGPTVKLMTELGVEPGVVAIADHYRGLADALVVDEADRDAASGIEALGLRAFVAPTVMRSDEDRVALARDCLAFAADLA